MSVSLPFSFTPGTKARASEVNADFQAIAAKFTEGAGGIADADISTTAGIKASKLSSVPGTRITQAQMDDDSVDLRVLKDDATAGAPNAAVNNANHIKDAIITNAKLVDATIKKGKLNLASVVITVPAIASGSSGSVTTGLLSSTAFPIGFYQEGSVIGSFTAFVPLRLFLDTGTVTYSLVYSNLTASTTGAFSVRVWYLVI